MRLELSAPISGVVQDEAGKPIAGADVTAMPDASEMEEHRYIYALGTTKTDAQGHWHIEPTPDRLGS